MAETIKTDNAGKRTRPPKGEESAPRARRAAPTGAAKGGSSGGTNPGGAAAPAPAPLRGNDKKLHDALMQLYGTAGTGIQTVAMMRGDVGLVAAGANITLNATVAADAWIDLAQQNPAVRQALEGFVQGSAVATLVGVHVAMVIPVLTARGVVPQELGNAMLKPDARKVANEFAAARDAVAQQRAAAAAAGNGGAPAA